MSKLADAETAGRGSGPATGQPTASAIAPPLRKRDDHAPLADGRVDTSRPMPAPGHCGPSIVDEDGDYVTEWDPRLT
jgi:hypothetical protein